MYIISFFFFSILPLMHILWVVFLILDIYLHRKQKSTLVLGDDLIVSLYPFCFFDLSLVILEKKRFFLVIPLLPTVNVIFVVVGVK